MEDELLGAVWGCSFIILAAVRVVFIAERFWFNFSAVMLLKALCSDLFYVLFLSEKLCRLKHWSCKNGDVSLESKNNLRNSFSLLLKSLINIFILVYQGTIVSTIELSVPTTVYSYTFQWFNTDCTNLLTNVI